MDAAIERLLAQQEEISDDYMDEGTSGDERSASPSSEEEGQGRGSGSDGDDVGEDSGDSEIDATSSSDDGDGEEDGEGDGEGDHPKGFGKVDGFARAFNRLVDNSVSVSDKAPILAGSKSVHRRKEEERIELEASKAAKKLREEMKKRGHYLPTKKGEDPQRDILEKRLQKTATKGVVQLFNAINAAQKRIRSEDTLGNKAKAAKLGKAGFLAGIRQVRERQAQEDRGTDGDANPANVANTDKASGKWDVLKGGFVGINDNSVRMRDWDSKQGNASDASDVDVGLSDSDDSKGF